MCKVAPTMHELREKEGKIEKVCKSLFLENEVVQSHQVPSYEQYMFQTFFEYYHHYRDDGGRGHGPMLLMGFSVQCPIFALLP